MRVAAVGHWSPDAARTGTHVTSLERPRAALPGASAATWCTSLGGDMVGYGGIWSDMAGYSEIWRGYG
jgi:hypothetical protein